MKRKSLTEAVSAEARDFIQAGTPKPQFAPPEPEKMEGEASPAPVSEPSISANDPPEKKEMPAQPSVTIVTQSAGESPLPVLVPQTFRLPQRLIEDLARAAIERKIRRRKPWSQQDIVAEAIKEWLRKHVSK